MKTTRHFSGEIIVPEPFPAKSVVGISILAIILRGLWLAVSGEDLRFPDEDRFWCEASNFAHGLPIGCGEDIAHDMPMTAILLSSVILATGPDIWAAKLLWITLSGLTVVPVAAIAWALYPTVQVVLLAACGFAFYPFSIYYSTLLLSETPFLLLMTGAVATMLILARDEVRTGKWKRNGLVLGVLLGLLFGVAHLTRPTLVYFFPFVLVWLCVVNHYSWKISVLSLITFVCVCAPWTVRNYVAFDGAFIPGTLGSGLVMWEGNNPWNDRGGVSQPEWARHLWPPEEVLTSMNEYQIDEWQKSKAIAHIRAEPGRFGACLSTKIRQILELFSECKGIQVAVL